MVLLLLSSCYQVLRIRRDILQCYRESHGQRIKLDHSGQTSIELSLDIRLRWACGEWTVIMQEVANNFGNKALLQAWKILPPGDAADPAPDDFLLCSLESISRVFWGLHARSLILWTGGVYNQVKLCSDDDRVRAQAVRRASLLWPRILILENMLVAGDVDPEVIAFNDGFLWHQGTCYRELHGLVSENHIAKAVSYSWQIHSCPYHEKGLLWKDNKIRIRFHNFVKVCLGTHVLKCVP